MNALLEMKSPHWPRWEAYSRMGGDLSFDRWIAAGKPAPKRKPIGRKAK